MKNRSTLDPAPSASLAADSLAVDGRFRGVRRFSSMLGSACLLAGFTILGSCQGLPRGKDGVTAIQFQDVVVPAGLRLIDNAHQSHSVEAASWRMGRFVYSGQVRPEEAAGYVRQRMPLHNWTLVQEGEPAASQTKLRYKRGYYAAEYTFSRVGGRTQLVVDYTTEYPER